VTSAKLPSTSATLIIATRESRLALWQAEHVQALLRNQLKRDVSLLGMTTRGDQILDRSLSKVGGKGLFVKELETALEERRADLAVHSLKDVPMVLPSPFVLACVLPREDPRDAWVSPKYPSLDALPKGACVGTSSLRRAVQLLAQRPDLRIEPLRGNLDTRLRKLDAGEHDAIVLAAAGLKRLGLASRIASFLDTDAMVPAAGQGALGIEVRADDVELRQSLAAFIDRPTWLATHAERAVSRGLGGSCSMPLAAHATWQGSTLRVDAVLGHAGTLTATPLRVQRSVALAHADLQAAQHAAEALGATVASALLALPAAAGYLQGAHAAAGDAAAGAPGAPGAA
jgi:hydroxymethylbilane synthase